MSVERKVKMRRVRRKLKAAASIGLAVAAGLFLACTPGKDAKDADKPVVPPVPPNPTTPEASPGTIVAPAASPPTSALAVRDAGVPSIKDAAVDRDQHRKGMPVPDNLLE
jgi:hypothetical protein